MGWGQSPKPLDRAEKGRGVRSFRQPRRPGCRRLALGRRAAPQLQPAWVWGSGSGAGSRSGWGWGFGFGLGVRVRARARARARGRVGAGGGVKVGAGVGVGVGVGVKVGVGDGVRVRVRLPPNASSTALTSSAPAHEQVELSYISPKSPLCLPYVSPRSPLCLPYISLYLTSSSACVGRALRPRSVSCTWLGLG